MATWEEVTKSVSALGASSDRMEYVVVSSSAVSVSISVDDIPGEKVGLLLRVAEGKEAEGATKPHAAPTAVERMASFIFLRTQLSNFESKGTCMWDGGETSSHTSSVIVAIVIPHR